MGPLEWLGHRWDGAHAGEDVVPTVGGSIAVLYRMALEFPGIETEASTR
jgi:hypothetical protein